MKRAFDRTEMGRYNCVVLSLIVLAVLATDHRVVDAGSANSEPNVESGSAGPGLRGVLPPYVPEGLTAEGFAVLGGNWEEWSAGVAAEVSKLYTNESLDAAGQRQVLQTLRSKLDVMERAIADSRYRSIRDELIGLHGKLERRVDVATAILDTLELSPEAVKADRVEAAAQQVLARLDDLQAALNDIPGGSAWLDYVEAAELKNRLPDGDSPASLVREVRGKLQAPDNLNEAQRRFVSRAEFTGLSESLNAYLQAAEAEVEPVDREALRAELRSLVEALEEYESEGGSEFAAQVRDGLKRVRNLAVDNGRRLMDTLRAHYLNYNLQVVASEDFLSRLVREQRTDEGPVRDFILGADVSGRQRTRSEVSIDVKPSRNGARFDVVLTGVTQSSTAGVTSRATVYTQGYHRFRAAKEIFFNGERFTTKPGRIDVDASNTTTGASTDYDGIPLFGSIGRSVAVNEARSRRGRSEAIARQRVSDRVLPEFNTEVEKSFQRANDRLRTDVSSRLENSGLSPRVRSFRTSENHLRISAQVMGPGELAGGTPHEALTQNQGVTLQVHESLLNRIADRMNFAGRAMNEADIRTEVETFLETLLGRDVTLNDSSREDPGGNNQGVFLFADSDPVRFQIDDEEVRLILRTGFRQQDDDDIPTQEVTIPLHYRVEGDQIRVERGNVKVSPTRRPESVARQIAHAGVIRKKVQLAIPDRTRDRTVLLKRDDNPDVTVNVTQMKALNGWLTIWAQ